MSLSNRVTEKDMALMPGILKFVSCENIPLRFEYGKQTVCGIPADFSPKVSHRMLTENIAQYIIEGTDEHGLTIRAEYLEYRDFPVTEWVFYLTNNGNKDTSVLKNIRIEGELACPDAFKDFEDRIAIISGEAKVTPETARKILRSIYFYPPAQHAYQCSICGRACDMACYSHLEKKGVLTKSFKTPFRKREEWKFKIEDFEVKKNG